MTTLTLRVRSKDVPEEYRHRLVRPLKELVGGP